MVSKFERFWILFILRFAIGFLFLFAALQQFDHGPAKFAEDLSKGFSGTWMANVEVGPIGGVGPYTGMDFIQGFLRCLPYVFAALAVLILTGLLLKTALRVSALLMISLGLGKYLQSQDIATLVNDFFIAFIICVALFFLALQRPPVAVVATAHPAR